MSGGLRFAARRPHAKRSLVAWDRAITAARVWSLTGETRAPRRPATAASVRPATLAITATWR